MAAQVKRTPRSYHSPLRSDQAERTRRRILASAFRLFAEHGYAGTTIAAIAETAGVSPETIYLSLGSKQGALEGAIEMAIAGADDGPDQQDSWWATVAELPTAAERLEKMVAYSCTILARTRPLHAAIRGAADKEPFAADLGRRLLHDRLTAQTGRIRKYLAHDLRPELSVDQAGQRYCVLASPELYYLLTLELGWTADQHEQWLTNLLKTDLLAPPTRPPPAASGRRRNATTSP
jgi:AcrR family transcriptional regulator